MKLDAYSQDYYMFQYKFFCFLDKDCKEIHYPITGTYGYANEFGNIWVQLPDFYSFKWRLLNIESGNLLTPAIEHIDCIGSNGTAVVSRLVEHELLYNHYEYALYDAKGNELAPFGKFSYIGNFHNGLALYSTTGYFHVTQYYDDQKEQKY